MNPQKHFLAFRKSRLALWAAGLLFALLLPFAAMAQQEVIGEIQVFGNRRIPKDTITARMGTRIGDPFDTAAIERDFMSLWNTGYFEDVRIEREEMTGGKLRLNVYVRERPTIREIKYVGLSSITQSDLLTRWKERKATVSQESQYDPTKVKRAEVVLKEYLAEKGRQFATIRTEVRPIPPNAVGITFVVREGPKVKVGRIDFDGNKKLSDRVLRSAMRGTKPIGIPKSILFENLFARTFDASKLQIDAELVRMKYQERGYFKALIGDPRTNMRDVNRSFYIPLIQKGTGKVVDITIPIEEGDRYRLKEITFNGTKAITNHKYLRQLFPLKDGDIFNTTHIRKGLENLTKAYGEFGYIKFTPVPDSIIDEQGKQITLKVDVEEGKPFYVRRIEFAGNTTTRDKVIRRELAVEEGGVYNSRLWEFSVLRLNQLNFFEQLEHERDTERQINEAEGTVDLTLKVKEKGKNSIGLTGGVSGISGSFIGISYETNNFLGLGEVLRVEASVGSRERNILFAFTEPYTFDRPLQLGFSVFSRKYDFNAAKENEIFTGQRLGNVSQAVLDTLQNFSQMSTGFTVSASYPLRRSLARVGLTYSYDDSSVVTFSEASRRYFEFLAFRRVSGPNSLEGIRTSKIIPTFSRSTVDSGMRPHSGRSIFFAADVSGLGGNVRAIRPVVEFKQFIPMRIFKPVEANEGAQTLGFRLQSSFLTGYGGQVAPPFERFYMGGDTDIRGFDIRTITPYAFITNRVDQPLISPGDPCLLSQLFPCTGVPIDPSNPRRGNVRVPLPVQQISYVGGDTSVVANLEYRIPIAGPVTLAAFTDFGMNMVLRKNQLRLSSVMLNELANTAFGCTSLNPLNEFGCNPASIAQPQGDLEPIPGTNYVPRMSTGLELQVLMPIINAPLRFYWAYNPLRLDKTVFTPIQIQRSWFPESDAGRLAYERAISTYVPGYHLREPSKTFRFTVATTF